VTSPVDPDQSTAVKRGEYLATIAACTECHGSHDPHHHPLKGLEFAGGDIVRLGSETVTVPNITPDETGLKSVTAQSFRGVMRTGQRDGRKLNPIMPCDQYAGMTDADLNDMYAYLQTVRPVKHFVDSVAQATYCRVCGNRHGSGERN
jgi:mono/diheme cytochrome c family protein